MVDWSNVEEVREYNKQYRQKPEVKERTKRYKIDNKEKIINQNREYRKNNNIRIKQYYKDNKEKIREYHKHVYQDNKKQIIKRVEQYRKNNKKKINQYYKIRRVNDSFFAIKTRLRNRLRGAFISYSKNGKVKTSDEYGINYKAIIEHLHPFPRDRHLYHIDHIKPLF